MLGYQPKRCRTVGQRILWAGMSVRSDGATPAPRDGASDRRGKDDDPVPPRRDRVATEASGTGEAVRRVGTADRDALQRPRAGAVQAVLLQEVPRLPPALRERAGPHRTGPNRRHVHGVRRHPTVSVSPRTGDPSRLAGLVRRRHVDLAGLPGKILPDLVNEDAEAEEADRRHNEKQENGQRVVPSESRVDRRTLREEAPGDVEPVRQGNRAANCLAPIREDGEGEQDPTEDVDSPGMPSARPWVCFAVKNEIPPRQIPIARSTDKPRIVLTTNNGTSAKAKCNRTPRNMTPNTKVIATANTETAILDAARPKMYT